MRLIWAVSRSISAEETELVMFGYESEVWSLQSRWTSHNCRRRAWEDKAPFGTVPTPSCSFKSQKRASPGNCVDDVAETCVQSSVDDSRRMPMLVRSKRFRAIRSC